MGTAFSECIESVAFDPEVLSSMGKAFDRACHAAQTSAEREKIARRIIELAKVGEHDSVELFERTVEILGLRIV